MDNREKSIYDAIDRLSRSGLIAHSAHRPAESDNFLTNLPAQRRPIVKQAVEESGLPVYVEDIATDVQDRIMLSHVLCLGQSRAWRPQVILDCL